MSKNMFSHGMALFQNTFSHGTAYILETYFHMTFICSGTSFLMTLHMLQNTFSRGTVYSPVSHFHKARHILQKLIFTRHGICSGNTFSLITAYAPSDQIFTGHDI